MTIIRKTKFNDFQDVAQPVPVGQEFEPIDAGTVDTPAAPNKTLFLDSADGLFKIKDENGNVELANLNEWGSITGTLSNQTDLQAELDAKENIANKNAPNGYCPLDGNALVPTANLPSFVDDVLEFADLASFPVTGETGKIYVAIDTGLTYRWSGSAYVELTDTTAVWGNISGNIQNQTDLINTVYERVIVSGNLQESGVIDSKAFYFNDAANQQVRTDSGAVTFKNCIFFKDEGDLNISGPNAATFIGCKIIVNENASFLVLNVTGNNVNFDRCDIKCHTLNSFNRLQDVILRDVTLFARQIRGVTQTRLEFTNSLIRTDELLGNIDFALFENCDFMAGKLDTAAGQITLNAFNSNVKINYAVVNNDTTRIICGVQSSIKIDYYESLATPLTPTFQINTSFDNGATFEIGEVTGNLAKVQNTSALDLFDLPLGKRNLTIISDKLLPHGLVLKEFSSLGPNNLFPFDFAQVDTTSNAVILTMPPATKNHIVKITDASNNFGTNNVTVNSVGGDTFNGVASPLILNASGKTVELIGLGGDWKVNII